MQGTDWAWCYENPKEAAEEIDRLQERVAELERQLRSAASCAAHERNTVTRGHNQ